ncbi:MAG TPA: AAA family ATPase [Longimicrobium sp.]|jgi:shikimate kinase
MDDAARAATLHLLTGPWASGKTSLVPHLARLLPDVVVFDWDVLLPGLSAAAGRDARRDPAAWDGLREMWIAIVRSVLAGGRDVLLCGPATPDDFARGGVSAGRCLYLDVPDETLADRLKARGVADAEIADELREMAELRRSGHAPLPAGGRAPHELAEDVAAWIRAAATDGRSPATPSSTR